MDDKRKTKKRSRAKVQKNPSIEGLRGPLIKADYFARFRYNLEELKIQLRKASGKSFYREHQVHQILDDLGYWTLVRTEPIFHFTEELEKSLEHQFHYLEKSFDYHPGDFLWHAPIEEPGAVRHLVRVIEKVASGGQDLFRVEVLEAGATTLVSRYELNYWNGAGSSLPQDFLGEAIDWYKDHFWLNKLNLFKEIMAAKQFAFDFTQSAESIQQQQHILLTEIQTFFCLHKGPLIQRRRGLGFLACAQGNQEDSDLVVAMAIQALGQMFGLQSRVWGHSEGEKQKPVFIVFPFQRGNLFAIPGVDERCAILSYQPIQRPLSEVLRRTVANGPFGKHESLSMVRRSEESPSAPDSLPVNND